MGVERGDLLLTRPFAYGVKIVWTICYNYSLPATNAVQLKIIIYQSQINFFFKKRSILIYKRLFTVITYI